MALQLNDAAWDKVDDLPDAVRITEFIAKADRLSVHAIYPLVDGATPGPGKFRRP
jgi:hypothetical protein